MREELNMEELTGVSGGRYVINGNTKKIAFRDAGRAYVLKCSPYQAMEACDSLIGQYETEKEYDKACIKMLTAKGWI